MKRTVVSIVVPVYNVEKYLHECVDSILLQTYKNLEVILVDDGSTDSSGKMCDEYAAADARVKVIHQKNQGASTARNMGISKASGEFLLFVDSDDTIDADTCEKVVACMLDNNADWVMWTPNDCPRNLRGGLYEGKHYQQLILNSIIGRGFGPSLFKQIYKRELFIKNHIQCPPQLRNFEDLATVLQYAFVARNIYYLKGPGFYHHRKNPTSLTQSYDSNIENNIITQIKYFKQLFEGSSLNYLPYLRIWISWQLLRIFNEEARPSNLKTLAEKRKIFQRFFSLDFIQQEIQEFTPKNISSFSHYIILKCAQHKLYFLAYCSFVIYKKCRNTSLFKSAKKIYKSKVERTR